MMRSKLAYKALSHTYNSFMQLEIFNALTYFKLTASDYIYVRLHK